MISKEEKSLTWRYFWEQKFNEVAILCLIFTAIILIPLGVGHYTGGNYDEFCTERIPTDSTIENCVYVSKWINGSFFMGITLAILFILYHVLMYAFMIIMDWICSNWDKASKRAKEDVRKVKQNRTGGKK